MDGYKANHFLDRLGEFRSFWIIILILASESFRIVSKTKGKRQLYHVTTISLSLSFDFYCFHTKITSFMSIFEQPGFGLFFIWILIIWPLLQTVNMTLNISIILFTVFTVSSVWFTKFSIFSNVLEGLNFYYSIFYPVLFLCWKREWLHKRENGGQERHFSSYMF